MDDTSRTAGLPQTRACNAQELLNVPATTMGLAALFQLIVLKKMASVEKCAKAATKEAKVAPARQQIRELSSNDTGV